MSLSHKPTEKVRVGQGAVIMVTKGIAGKITPLYPTSTAMVFFPVKSHADAIKESRLSSWGIPWCEFEEGRGRESRY